MLWYFSGFLRNSTVSSSSSFASSTPATSSNVTPVRSFSAVGTLLFRNGKAPSRALATRICRFRK